MLTTKTELNAVREFAKQLAVSDRKACALAGTEMSGEWTAEHTKALADHFEMPIKKLGEDAIRVAEEAYADEAQRDEPAADVAHGYTLTQWLAAAGRDDTASEYNLRAAWRAGEDPAEYRSAK